jgi:23S rRNA pseudouridine1911/1915/1917 synthase
VCQNDNISLADELKAQISRKFYKNIRSTNAKILVNGKELPTYKTINKGDEITVFYDKVKEINWPLYYHDFDILYEDNNYLVVDKRSDLLSIPTKGCPYSLYQEVMYYLKNKNDDDNVSILNRLDKDTCGLVVIAKNRLAAYKLEPTHLHMVRKYYALCEGIFDKKEGRIETFIEKDEETNKRFVSNKGKIAITNYKVIKEENNNSLVEFVLETGRTHQIRVHSAYLNHPIVGDILYGNSKESDLHLCSYYVEFLNPFTNRIIICELDCRW